MGTLARAGSDQSWETGTPAGAPLGVAGAQVLELSSFAASQAREQEVEPEVEQLRLYQMISSGLHALQAEA